MSQKQQIEDNIKRHDKVSEKYNDIHGEIFNDIEQNRLRKMLSDSVKKIKTDSDKFKVLDFGCGSGNLTDHLLKLGLQVTAADVTPSFLKLIKEKHKDDVHLDTLELNGKDLGNIKDNSYDMVATYSVLHHVPDYLSIIREMVRVLKYGGVLYLDHETNETYWNPSQKYNEFISFVGQQRFNWKKLFSINSYFNKMMKIFNPRYQAEGDIHVFADDHIMWDKIAEVICNNGCKIITGQDYLLYKSYYHTDTYNKYKEKCSDYHVLVARKQK